MYNENKRPKKSRLLHDIFLAISYLSTLTGIVLDMPVWMYLYSHRRTTSTYLSNARYEWFSLSDFLGLFTLPMVAIGAALIFIGIILGILASNVEPKGESIYSSEMDEYRIKADDAHAAGDIEGELTALRQMSLASDVPSDISLRIAKLQEQKSDIAGALELYLEIIGKDADCAGAYVGATRCMIDMKRYDEAFEYAEKSTSLTSPKSPDYAEVMANYAIVSAKSGDMQTAEYALQEAELAGWEDIENLRRIISE